MFDKTIINPYGDRGVRTERICKRLKEDYIFLSSQYDVLGVFLFGSQNYETDLPDSDIDVKAIVMPPVTNLLIGNGVVNETHKRDNGELTVFDIRSMHNNIKKVNINFLEILYTDWRIINPRYSSLWMPMINLREDIAFHNKRAAMECIYGCALNKFDKVFKKVPSNVKRIETAGYDYKAWSDILRFQTMMSRYKEDVPYAECLIPYTPEIAAKYDKIIRTKAFDYKYSPNEIKEDVSNLRQTMEFFMDKFREDTKDMYIDETILSIIDNVTEDCLKAYLNERCYKERWPVLSY